jgi:hypothetical protein
MGGIAGNIYTPVLSSFFSIYAKTKTARRVFPHRAALALAQIPHSVYLATHCEIISYRAVA